MRIGELVVRSGLSASRIRFYEAQGLLSVERRANGYRSYSAEALLALNVIVSAQDAGFTLGEIRRLMPADLSGWRDTALLGALRQRVGEMRAIEKRLARTRSQIEGLIGEIEDRPDGISCEANADRLLSRFKNGGVGQALGR